MLVTQQAKRAVMAEPPDERGDILLDAMSDALEQVCYSHVRIRILRRELITTMM